QQAGGGTPQDADPQVSRIEESSASRSPLPTGSRQLQNRRVAALSFAKTIEARLGVALMCLHLDAGSLSLICLHTFCSHGHHKRGEGEKPRQQAAINRKLPQVDIEIVLPSSLE